MERNFMRLVLLYSLTTICLNFSCAMGAMCTEQIPEAETTAFNVKIESYYRQAIKLSKMTIAVNESESSDSNDAILRDLRIQLQDVRQQFLQSIFDESEIIDNYEHTRCISPESLKSWRKKLSNLRVELLAH
jgi:hypothetical protein